MIAAVAAAKSPVERTLVPDSVRVWSSGSLGVVASTVTLPVEGETKAFANVKVFARDDDARWRCLLWQVSPRPLPLTNRQTTHGPIRREHRVQI